MRDESTITTATGAIPPHTSHSDSSVAKHDAHLMDDGTASVRDNTRLADLGYRPELRRDFSALETFGVAFSIM